MPSVSKLLLPVPATIVPGGTAVLIPPERHGHRAASASQPVKVAELTNGQVEGRPAGVRRIPNFRLRSTPEKLAAAALQQFSEKGYGATRLETVARQLGLSKSAVYMHFPTKRALFDFVVEEFCLADRQPDEDPSGHLRRTLSAPADPAGTVLRIVLREWPGMPEIGSRYLETLVARLSSREGLPEHMARRLVNEVLAPVTLGILFSAGSLGALQ